MQREHPPRELEAAWRVHFVHAEIEGTPVIAGPGGDAVEEPRGDPVINPARTDEEDIDLFLLFGVAANLEGNASDLTRKESAECRAGENEHKDRSNSAKQCPGQ